MIMLCKLASQTQPGPDYRAELHKRIEDHWDDVVLLDPARLQEGNDERH